MEGVMIFPYDNKSKPLVKANRWLSDMQIRVLGFPKGWEIFNEWDEFQDIKKSTEYNKMVELCSVLWIVDAEHELSNDDYIFPLIERAVQENKKIICTRILNEEENKRFDKIVPEKNRCILKEEPSFKLKYSLEFFHINTPVLLICGMFENLNKFLIQVGIREEFISRGYKVCQIGSRQCSNILGFYPMPQFMFDSSISEKDKILMFNHYLKIKEVQEKPDIIIIGIPGGIFPFSEKIVENFGMMLYEITQTVNVDCTVFSTPYYEEISSVVDIFSEQAMKMYNFDIDYFIVQNKMIELMESEIEHKMVYLTLPQNHIVNGINRVGKDNIFYIDDKL